MKLSTPLAIRAGALLAFLALMLFLPSCCSRPDGFLDPARLGGLAKVLDRHDAYVTADDQLTQLEAKTYLRTSEELRLTLAEALAARDAVPAGSGPAAPAEAPGGGQ